MTKRREGKITEIRKAYEDAVTQRNQYSLFLKGLDRGDEPVRWNHLHQERNYYCGLADAFEMCLPLILRRGPGGIFMGGNKDSQ